MLRSHFSVLCRALFRDLSGNRQEMASLGECRVTSSQTCLLRWELTTQIYSLHAHITDVHILEVDESTLPRSMQRYEFNNMSCSWNQ